MAAAVVQLDGSVLIWHMTDDRMVFNGLLFMAGPAINLVQGFRTKRELHWEFLRLWTGFELLSSCRRLP